METGFSEEEIRQTRTRARQLMNDVLNKLLQRYPKILQPALHAAATGCGAGLGGAASLGTLYFAGINGLSAVGITSGLAAVGGGMVLGVGVLALPVLAGGVAGYAVLAQRRRGRLTTALNQAIQELYQIQEQLVVNAEYFEAELAEIKAYIEHLERQKPKRKRDGQD